MPSVPGDWGTGNTSPHVRELVVPDAFARAQAYVIDNLVLAVPCVLEWLLLRFCLEKVDYFGMDLLRQTFEMFVPGIVLGVGVFVIVLPLIMCLNLFILEMIMSGRTPGKKLSGLRVVSQDGGTISARQAFVRNLLRLVDMLPAYYVLGLATMVGDRLRRRIGDKMAKTVVIVERLDVLPFMKEPVKRIRG